MTIRPWDKEEKGIDLLSDEKEDAFKNEIIKKNIEC